MTATIDRPRPTARLTTGGILRSEWVKLTTLRSTWWCLGLIAAMTAGMPVLIALVLGFTGDPAANVDLASYEWSLAITVSTGFTVLIAAVLGSLVITGEYATGMIRSSLTAAPGRLSTLFAKSAVMGATLLVVQGLALVVGALLAAVILGANGYAIDVADARVWTALLGAAVYPALIAVFATGIGTMLRNSAGAIASVLGLLLVVPTILQLAGMLLQARWVLDVNAFLPSSLGSAMTSFPMDAFAPESEVLALEPWQAALVLLAWAGAALVGGVVVLTRRDA